MSLPVIHSIFLDGWRTFSNLKIDIDEKTTILVGPNGVGKSSILDTLNTVFSRNYMYLGKDFFESDLSVAIFEFSKLKFTKKNQDFYFNIQDHITYIDLKDACNLFDIIKKEQLDGTVFRGAQQEKSIKQFVGKDAQLYLALSRDQNGYTARRWYCLCEERLYLTHRFGEKLEREIENRRISFNRSNYREIFQKHLENQPDLNSSFLAFNNSSSQKLNSVSASNEHTVRYIDLPKMNIEIKNKEGKLLEQLSSGQKQLEELKFFSHVVSHLKPLLVMVDEPELHLNYGQLTYLTDFQKKLEINSSQVIISTHSLHYIRSSDYKNVRFLKLNSSGECELIPLTSLGFNDYSAYPELFYSEGIILVEGFADKIFFERVISSILSSKGKEDLSSRNINIISVGSKKKMKSIKKLIEQNLKTPCFVIADLDLILNRKDFPIFDTAIVEKIWSLIEKRVSEKKQTMAQQIDNMPSKLTGNFVNFLDDLFKKNEIGDEDRERYKGFREYLVKRIYTPALKNSKLLRQVLSLFITENVFILSGGTVEDYISAEFKNGGKLSIELMNDNFYPSSIENLKHYMTDESLSELDSMVKKMHSFFEKKGI